MPIIVQLPIYMVDHDTLGQSIDCFNVLFHTFLDDAQILKASHFEFPQIYIRIKFLRNLLNYIHKSLNRFLKFFLHKLFISLLFKMCQNFEFITRLFLNLICIIT